MRHLLLAGLLVPQLAWADCVYTGAKGAYVRCIYDELVAWGGQLTTYGADLLGLQTRADATEAQAIALESDADALDMAVTGYGLASGALGLRLDGLEAGLAPLPGQLLTLSGTVDDQGTALTSLSSVANNNATALADHASSIGALQTTAVGLDAQLDALEAELDAVNAELADHAAVIDGLVTSNGGMYSAYIQKNNGTASMITETGDWIATLTTIGTGTRVVFNAGLFASTPHCVCTSTHFGGVSHMSCDINAPSATQMDVYTAGMDGVARNRDFWLFCRAP